MKKITYIIVLLFIALQTAYAQEKYSRIKISNPNQATLDILAQEGIDLRCGVSHEENQLTLDVSYSDRAILQQFGIPYTTLLNDLSKFYGERAENSLPAANLAAQLEDSRTIANRNSAMQERGSVSSAIIDNYLQYQERNEKDWVKPLNFELGTMGGCLTLSAMEAELDQMRAFSQSNGLNIVSVKQDASTTGRKTWGNPSSTIANPQYDSGDSAQGPPTYTGIGTTRWDPKTIYYVRITGNESSTPEGSKPQMLFTSMIHAREVSALMNNMYFMWYLIENYDTDLAIKNLVDNNELYFIPVVNPDGLRWNEHLDQYIGGSGGGMQRKNLRPSTGGNTNTSSSRGVDLNRNFDYFWGSAGTGSSNNQFEDSYRGPSAESEPETKIIKEFVLARNFKTAIWNHSFANSIPHPYGGNPSFVSGREDEMHEMHSDMTKYNRYVSGATIFSPSNGIADDWMLGGSADANGSSGSGKNVLATTPEHGSEGFWPNTNSIIPIAKRSVRISLMGAYYGGKYAKFHDLTQSDITSLTADLDFGIERIGQTASDFTLTVTPISSNISNIVSPAAESNMSVLEQRKVTATLTLNPSIQPNEKIEYKIELSNDDGVFYEANIEKYYQPTVLLFSDAQAGFSDWTRTGWNRTSTGGYNGSRAFRTQDVVPYANGTTKTMTTVNSFDLSGSNEVLVQFYTKWDIERNFDFVEIQASTNGTNWTTLNGKYTKPKSSSDTNDHVVKSPSNEAFQGANASGHVFDGDQMDNWVMEEIVINSSDNSSLFEESNVFFRFRMRSDTNNVFENYSANAEGFYVDDFKVIGLTIPCATTVPTNLAVNTITASGANTVWDNIPSATYDIRYRETSSSTWIEITDLISPNYSIPGLTASTDYEVQVRSKCNTATSAYSDSVLFSTTALTYCNAGGGSIADEYIGGVTLNGTINDTSPSGSGTSSGYSDFTGATIFEPIQIGSTGNSISVSKFWINNYNEAVSVWIDFNKNGSFESSEKVLEDGANQNTPVSDSFSVPLSASTGNTRMRVLMKYYNDLNSIQNDACEDFQYGEVEDYSVYLYEGLLYTNSTWYPNAPNATTGSVNALILDGVYNANSNIALNNLTVNSGAEINLDKANVITVNNNIINNGEFVLNSDSNEFSSLLVDGTVSGDIKYNRHVNSNVNGNDLVAPPVSGQSFVDFLSNNTNVFANGTQTQFLFGDFEKPTNEYQLYSNVEPESMIPGQGYRVASTDNGTFIFEGSVTNTALNIPIERSGTGFAKWNLIGNPYTSYITLEDFLTTNIAELDSQSAAVYGYDADDSNGSKWAIWNLAYAAANPNTLITPGQGFFVSSKAGGANISFTPAMRTSGTSDDFISGRTNTIAHSVIRINSATKVFETELYFTNDATSGLDIGYDAEHFGSAPSDFSVYSELVQNNDGQDMAIQSISFDDVNNNAIIPLGVNVAQGEQITISMVNSDMESNIYLEDAETNTFTLLNTSDYTFTPDVDLTDVGRFYLRFDQDDVLSIDDQDLDKLQIYNDDNLKQIVVEGQLNEDTSLVLFDIQGRQILAKDLNINNSINTISTFNFSKGIYLVKLSNNKNTISKKLIIR